MRKQILILLFIAIYGTINAQSKADTKNILLIGQEKNYTISKATLTGDPVLHLSDAYKNYHITSYQISYVAKGQESELLGPFKIQGNNMANGPAADILRKARPGDRIFLEEVMAISNEADKIPLKLALAIRVQ